MCDITSFLYKTGVIAVQAVGMPCPVSQQADNTAFICQSRTRSSKRFGCRRWNYRAKQTRSMGKQTTSMYAGIDPGCQVGSILSSMKNTINTVLVTNEAEF